MFEIFRCTLAIISLPLGMALGFWLSGDNTFLYYLTRPFYLIGRWIRGK